MAGKVRGNTIRLGNIRGGGHSFGPAPKGTQHSFICLRRQRCRQEQTAGAPDPPGHQGVATKSGAALLLLDPHGSVYRNVIDWLMLGGDSASSNGRSSSRSRPQRFGCGLQRPAATRAGQPLGRDRCAGRGNRPRLGRGQHHRHAALCPVGLQPPDPALRQQADVGRSRCPLGRLPASPDPGREPGRGRHWPAATGRRRPAQRQGL